MVAAPLASRTSICEEALIPMSHRHDPCRLIDHWAEVVSVVLVGLADVKPDTDLQLGPRSPIDLPQSLEVARRNQRPSSTLEGGGEGVARSREDKPVVFGDGLGGDLIVDFQRRRHGVGILRPQAWSTRPSRKKRKVTVPVGTLGVVLSIRTT